MLTLITCCDLLVFTPITCCDLLMLPSSAGSTATQACTADGGKRHSMLCSHQLHRPPCNATVTHVTVPFAFCAAFTLSSLVTPSFVFSLIAPYGGTKRAVSIAESIVCHPALAVTTALPLHPKPYLHSGNFMPAFPQHHRVGTVTCLTSDEVYGCVGVVLLRTSRQDSDPQKQSQPSSGPHQCAGSEAEEAK